MPINTLIVENFKGIQDKEEFEIRPITIFCGANSSGKSSCIHAIAALAQTVKLSASPAPIVLDDEYAQIHLGRFLDVVHSKSIKDSFTVGLGMKTTQNIYSFTEESPPIGSQINAEVTFRARGTAQTIYTDSLSFKLNDMQLKYIKNKKEYWVFKNEKKLDFLAIPQGKFNFRPRMASLANGELESEKQQEIMEAFIFGENMSSNLVNELSNVFYLGPFRQGPLRRYATRGAQPSEVGSSGESAVSMLANEFSKSQTRHPNITKVGNWINEMKLGKKIQLTPVKNTDLFDVSLTMDDGAELSVPDLGYGVSQVLPVLVQCSFAPKGSTLLFEQPELHLHQGAARKLGGILADVAKDKNINIIAETHSPHLFHEILQKVKSGKLRPDDVVLYDVCRRNGRSEFKKILIELDEDGSIYIDHPWKKNLEE